jgi:hypothetical protein
VFGRVNPAQALVCPGCNKGPIPLAYGFGTRHLKKAFRRGLDLARVGAWSHCG